MTLKKLTDLPYDNEALQAGDKRRLDVTLPATGNGCCLFLIHGGGWHAGSKEQWRTVAEYYSLRGYVCVSAGYRLAPEFQFPVQFRDIRLAYSFVKARAKEWNFDPQRMAAWGSSAGGHLAGLLATTSADDDLGLSPQLKNHETRPAAIVGLCPVNSLLPGARTQVAESEEKLLGGEPADKIELARLASPSERVDSATPPFLIVVGDADEITTVAHQEAMLQVLKRNQVPTELVVLSGVGHGFGYGIESAAQQRTLEVAEQFLCKHLKPNDFSV